MRGGANVRNGSGIWLGSGTVGGDDEVATSYIPSNRR